MLMQTSEFRSVIMSKTLNDDALQLHRQGTPGKLEVIPTIPMATQRDLSLAYSPGVAAPCIEIAADPLKAYDYTAKGNLVAVITNGTAVLGLGDIGPLASKPVMEGKSVLFKRFAKIDSIDLEVDAPDPDSFIDCVKRLGPSFGGINLEDIKAPDSFEIERRLQHELDIPVFHDDQHGTAVVVVAGLINALEIVGKSFEDAKFVVAGAGSSALAVVSLIKVMGTPDDQILVCDRGGVLHEDRLHELDPWRAEHVVTTKSRTLLDAFEGADVAIGLAASGVFTAQMISRMGRKPIVFAMSNPTPEIMPEQIVLIRPDAIIATGRSDYPNQVNNVLGFPYLFRGALDVRASSINQEMKISCAKALARLAQDTRDLQHFPMFGDHLFPGPGYIIPSPFDPRLLGCVSSAVVTAAMNSGVARVPINDLEQYKRSLNHLCASSLPQAKTNVQ